MTSQPTASAEIFYSYSHNDEELRDELDKHLSLLERQGLISEWHDREIEAGDDWESDINTYLDSAHIILLLVSADFISSEYCYSTEMKRALERHEDKEARVIPIILRPVDWESSPLGKLQALPKGGKPVTLWDNQDEAFKNVAQGIRKVIGTFKPKAKPPDTSAVIPRPPVVGFVARRDTPEDGRDIVELLKEKLAPGSNQLVTLSGPGGVGKTTLAAEAARQLKDAYGGRLVWSYTAARAGYTLPTLLDDIATQLNRADLRTLKPEEKEATVRALVAAPPALVVLDNCETITPDEWQRIETWFDNAQCSALFTSRQTINKTFNVKLLVMHRDEAEELLEKLIAQTQDPQIFFADVRQQIYDTAEANPFLMEWIVAQIGAAQEPATVFRELSEGEGNVAQRVFDRSFNLPQLGDDGRAALLALSLFTPSASREALGHVAGFDDDTKRLNEAVKNLHALWLVKAIDQNRRLTVEGLTRSLAAVRLSKDSRAADFRQRFVAYFLRYAEAYKQPTNENFDALERDKDNLLSAIDLAFERSDSESVLRIMLGLNYDGVNGWLAVRGYWDEALRYGRQALEAAKALQSKWHIGAFANSLGALSAERGDYVSAKLYYGQAITIARELDAKQGLAATLNQLGMLAQDQGEISEARRLLTESLEINRSLGNQKGICGALHNLAVLAQQMDETEEARRLYGESLEISRRLGNQSGIAITLHQLGRLAQDAGEPGEARRLYEESLEIAKRLGDQSGIADTLHQLGRLAEDEGNKEEAERLFRDALSIFERLGSHGADVTRRSLERVKGGSS